MKIEFLPEAREEFYDAAGFYEGREIGLGMRFRAEISEGGLRLAKGEVVPPFFQACLTLRRRYFHRMSDVIEIEQAVRKLSRSDLTAFREWFLGFDAEAWDRQFEEDVTAGRLDALADEAISDLRGGRCRDL